MMASSPPRRAWSWAHPVSSYHNHPTCLRCIREIFVCTTWKNGKVHEHPVQLYIAMSKHVWFSILLKSYFQGFQYQTCHIRFAMNFYKQLCWIWNPFPQFDAAGFTKWRLLIRQVFLSRVFSWEHDDASIFGWDSHSAWRTVIVLIHYTPSMGGTNNFGPNHLNLISLRRSSHGLCAGLRNPREILPANTITQTRVL